jgi:hypothetical protein
MAFRIARADSRELIVDGQFMVKGHEAKMGKGIFARADLRERIVLSIGTRHASYWKSRNPFFLLGYSARGWGYLESRSIATDDDGAENELAFTLLAPVESAALLFEVDELLRQTLEELVDAGCALRGRRFVQDTMRLRNR